MQHIPDELKRVLESRLKLGDLAKPVCRVEVDRLVFIPGRIEEIEYANTGATPETLEDFYISDENNAQTITSSLNIAFPASDYDISCKSSNFGMRWGKMHQGVDLAVPVGTSVVAAWSGKIKYVTEKGGGYGKYIDVEHANGIVTRYGHLSKLLVSKGQLVSGGQQIALSGNTGRSTGPHLHFEIQIKGTPVDPLPYLLGKKKIAQPTTSAGAGVVKTDTYVGHVGEVLFSETFESMDWFKNAKYSSISPHIQTKSVLTKKNGANFCKISFSDTAPIVASLSFKVDSDQPGVISLKFASDMREAGELRIYVDENLKMKFLDFEGTESVQELHKVAFQAGTKDVRIEIRYVGGEVNRGKTYYMMLDTLTVNKFHGDPSQGNMLYIDPSLSDATSAEQTLAEALWGGGPVRASLQVGQFSYMDTLVLDSVTQIEFDDQFEMDSREARITISNPKGYYSPDYNPFYFPEMYQQTPWSYFINGYQYGVISENAPVRIFLGYGNNLMRVFTGLIDKVDMESEEPRITISCRDMYKKILNKVLQEDKAYPEDIGHSNFNADVFGGSNSGKDRYREIISKAKYYAKQLSPSLDYMFLLAIAKHETQFGTTGAGRPESGSFILGYGVYSDTNKDWAYAGIDKQLYRGARRYKEAMGSKNWEINTLADTKYFWQGGDKGAYQWAVDTNWPNAVWTIYSGYKSNPPSEFTTEPVWAGTGNLADTVTATPAAKDTPRPWVKSSIVQDLIDHAGMTGWRAAPNDIGYPDYVIEETYLIELNQKTGKYMVAVPDKEGEFEEKEFESILTPNGWMNPFVDPPRDWRAFTAKVSDCITEVLQDTNYRSYCDRYGTYRLELINLKKPVVATFTEYDHLVSLNKTINYSNARSLVVITDGKGTYQHFTDTELLMELKGELRTGVINVPYATTKEARKDIADRFFWDIKRLSRTLQISIPANPALEILDRVYISDKNTTTRSIYTIKGIRSSFTVDGGYMQIIDLMWSGEGAVL